MNPASGNFYASWRAQIYASNFLRDEHFPTERLLQAVWQHQRVRRDALKTLDGRTVRVYHPGFVSVEGGPDFRDAVVQIGEDLPRSGDVEIDLRAGGWRAHGHDRNPNFHNVLLHVIWEDMGIHASACGNRADPLKPESLPAILCLQNVLDAPLAELSLSLENEPLRVLPQNLRGKCAAALRELTESQLLELLNSAAGVRLESRAAQFRARAQSAGWEQALWENLFRALGYKQNAWPMQNLAERRQDCGGGLFELQARLFGISGLLPTEIGRRRPASRDCRASKPGSRKRDDHYLRELWDFWWRERDKFEGCVLPRSLWKFHGLRPANHPQRRIALASHWLADVKLIAKIEEWISTAIPQKKLPGSLHEILQVECDPYWSWHWTFASARLKNSRPLLGKARVTDLAMNAVLPWLWIRARAIKNENIQQEVERRFFSWPAGADNSVLRLARQRLLGLSEAEIFKTASAQQGLMQIVRDFCELSNAICRDCRLPEFVCSQDRLGIT